MDGFEIRFRIYAENIAEAENAQQAIIDFISEHAQQGRPVTGAKIAGALRKWKNNALVRNQVINYFNS